VPYNARVSMASELWAKVKDWVWLAVSMAFVVIGAAMVVSEGHRNEGIVIVALFGTCTVAAGLTVARKLRSGSHAPRRVEVSTPLRPLRGRVFALGLLLVGLGGVLLVFGAGFGGPMQGIGGLITLTGIGVVVGVLAGVIPVGLIQFERLGLRLGRRQYAVVVPWEGMSRVLVGEYYDTPAVFITLLDSEQFVADPPHRRNLARKEIRRTEQWVGAQILIMPTRYGLSAESLAMTIELYRATPAARSQLPPGSEPR